MIREENMGIGKSVGAIIIDLDGKYLVQYRLKHPMGLAMPAGHIDKGETPKQAIERELLEETNLKVVSTAVMFQKFVPGDCEKDHAGHDWWVFYVVTEGVPRLMEPAKHKFVKFMSSAKIRDYVKRYKSDPKRYPCDPNWADYIFPALDFL